MNQPGNPGQPQENPQLPFVPGNFATFRASFATVHHLNGQFIMMVGEDRIITKNDGALGAANFELGRFEMNPFLAYALAQSLLQALQKYREAFGPLPQSMLPPQIREADDVIAALEQMLKDSREPPKPPGADG